jgi:hypothetical protein
MHRPIEEIDAEPKKKITTIQQLLGENSQV